ncbi:MAG: hypothetical protein ACO1SV_06350 [Fimbriimonas sp.]
MNRGKRAFLITIGIAGALLGIAYLQFRPTWRTATEAEVRAVIDPALLAVDPPDPRAQARLKKVEALIKEIDAAAFANDISEAQVSKFLAREEGRLKRLSTLVAEGPLQRPVPVDAPKSFPDFSRQRPLYRALARVGLFEITAGRKSRGLRILLLAMGLSNRLRATEDSTISGLVATAMDAILHAAVREALPHLGEAELRALAEALPKGSDLDAPLERAMRMEFQTYLLPMLPDPLAWSRREAPNEDPHRSLAALFSGVDEEPSDALGNYDAIQTARDVSRVAGTSLKNVGRRRPDWDLSGEKHADGLIRSLPEDHSAGTSGVERKLKGWVYRWELTRVPNSAGRRLLGLAFSSTLSPTSLSRQASIESIHALIALRRYQVRKGTTAPTLDAVVREGLLPALPIDPFSRGSLRYDPAKKRIWSLGNNGVDDGGNAFRMATPAEPDIVWTTP